MTTIRKDTYYFNPNASPEELYPIIPYLICLGDCVTIWNPNPDLMANNAGYNFYEELLNVDSGFSHKLSFIFPSDAKFSKAAQSKKKLANIVMNGSSKNYRSTGEMNSISFKSKQIWNSLFENNKQALYSNLHIVKRNLRSNFRDKLENQSRGNEEQEYFSLFESVYQDYMMLEKSHANSLLVRTGQWVGIRGIIQSINSFQLSSLSNQTVRNHYPIDKTNEEVFSAKRNIRDFVGEVEFAQSLRFFNSLNDFENFDFKKFKEFCDDYSNEIKAFKSLRSMIYEETKDLDTKFSNRVELAIERQDEKSDNRILASLHAFVFNGAAASLGCLGLDPITLGVASGCLGVTGKIAEGILHNKKTTIDDQNLINRLK